MDNKNYILRDQDDEESEWDRLDKLFQGINTYLGGKLSFAPTSQPSKILDLGAGSGAWAIKAAQMYPEAAVLAADIAPLPPRPLPPNVSYQKVNLLEPIMLEKESFDVIHLRFVLFHLPNARSIIEQAIHLLKPQGWLLIEDSSNWTGHSGPAQIAYHDIFLSTLSSKGLNYDLGGSLEKMLQETAAFSEVNVHEVQLAITHDDVPGMSAELRAFSKAMTSTVEKLVTGSVGQDFRDAGVTPELQKAWKIETEDPQYLTWHGFHFTWSRKHA